MPTVAQIMRNPYLELAERRENIAEIVLAEEKSFAKILDISKPLIQQEEGPILDSANKANYIEK